jgi:hypothetical protein
VLAAIVPESLPLPARSSPPPLRVHKEHRGPDLAGAAQSALTCGFHHAIRKLESQPDLVECTFLAWFNSPFGQL